MTKEEKISLFETNLKIFKDSVVLSKGEKLYSEGEGCNHLFFLKEGRINLFKNIDDKSTYMWSAIGPEFVGVTSFYSENYLFTLSTVAASKCVVYPIKVSDFKNIFDADSSLMTMLYADLCKRIKFIYHQTQVFTKGSSKQKIINALLNNNINGIFSNGFSVEEVSVMAGVSVRYSMKILNELCGKGMISIKNKLIFVKDLSGLKIVAKLNQKL